MYSCENNLQSVVCHQATVINQLAKANLVLSCLFSINKHSYLASYVAIIMTFPVFQSKLQRINVYSEQRSHRNHSSNHYSKLVLFVKLCIAKCFAWRMYFDRFCSQLATLYLLHCRSRISYSFMDYINGGCQLNLIVAIDFTVRSVYICSSPCSYSYQLCY